MIIVKSKNNTKKSYVRSLEETEMILDNIPGLVFYKDDNNSFIWVNKYIADAYKTKREDLIGKSLFELYPKEVAQKYYDDDLEVIKSKKPKLNFIEPWDVEEGRRWVNTNKIPLYDDDGKCIGIIGFSTDVTEQVKTEQKLKQAQNQLNSIFSNLKDTVFVISEDFKILFKNENAHSVFGEDLVGRNCFEVIKGGEQVCENCPIQDLLTKDVCQIHSEQQVHSPISNKIKTFDVITTSIENYNGKKVYLELLRDITVRKKMEQKLKESEENYRLIAENANDLIYIVNPKFEMEFVNEQAYMNILGYSKEEMEGKTGFKLVHPDDLERNIDAYKKGLLKGEGLTEVRLKHKQGNYLWFEFKGKKFLDPKGNIKGLLIGRDITERKVSEKKLRDLNRDLEKIVEARTNDLKIKMEELKRSNKELEQFAYVASHDLQEPLRMVASFTQLLQNRYQDKLDDDANDFINYAVDGATRMQNLISDLLIFSRVGMRGKPFKSTDMNTVLETVINTFRQTIKESSTEVTYDPLPVVLADESQMIQLVQNLISNAIKFRGEEPPRIHISGEVKADNWIFSVSDNGIGMESKYFNRIFVIFQRLHKKDKYGGTGIGLAVCKKIIQRHGGKIWVESELKKGSIFHFSIPRN